MSSALGATHAKFGYNGGLDGLRAIAITGVVLQHGMYSQSGGVPGVTIFFVVSGYLITSLLAAEFAARGAIRFGDFYRRRFVRLAPALFTVVLVTLAYLFFTQSPIEQWWGGAVGAATYTTDLVGAFFGNQTVTTNFQFTWTLGIEEQFYLLWPLLLLFLLKFRRLAPSMLVLGLGVVLVWEYRTIVNNSSPDYGIQSAYNYGPFSHVDGLLLGCAIALILIHYPQNAIVLWVARIVGPIGAILLGIYLLQGQVPYINDWFGSTALIAGCTVFWVAAIPNGVMSRAFSFRPFAFIGRMSYGIYLWNIFFLVVFQAIFGELPAQTPWGVAWLACVLGAGYVSYRFVETPIRRRWATPQARAVVAETAVTAATPDLAPLLHEGFGSS